MTYPPTIADQLTPALREAVRLASAGYGVLWALRLPDPPLGDVDALIDALRAPAAELAAELAAAVAAVRAVDVEVDP